MSTNNHKPVVLCFSGSDPTGGAGITADILTLSSLGCHPATVITAVTAQDTLEIKQFVAVAPEMVVAQARAVLEDMPVAAIKIGMIANTTIASTIASICKDYPQIPVVVDPVLSSGGGQELSDEPLEEVIVSMLMPLATLATPNSIEARRLCPDADTLDACAGELLASGCSHVLITGTHEPSPAITHRLYSPAGVNTVFNNARLDRDYHGSGCTLASACAAGLAHGTTITDAVGHALNYTFDTLRFGARVGMGQWLPERLYWADDETTPEKY